MRVNATHKYDASMETLFEHFSNPEFYVQKFEACGARNIKVVESESDEGSFEITVEREVPADVPGFLANFVSDWNTLTQTETWEGAPGDEYYNELEISAAGVPVEMRGSMNLMPDGDGCVNDIEIEIKCAIPLVGKKLEQFIAADTANTLAAEYAYIREFLGEEDD